MATLPAVLHHPSRAPGTESPVSHFVRWVHENLRQGYNGSGARAGYITLDALQAYWTRERIQALYDSLPAPQVVVSRELIRTDYVRVFSTLVYAGWPEKVRDFVRYNLHDGVFPLESPHESYPRASPFSDCFTEFAQHQWMFFPLIIPFRHPHERFIQLQRIVPISSKEPIQEGPDTWVYKIQLDPECSGLPDGTNSKPKFYVLKVYRKDFSTAYEAEVAAFAVLANYSKSYASFLRSYGQYKQGDTFNLVLDYMDGGNLEQYMWETRPPLSPADRIDLWDSMRGVLAGLVHFHAVNLDDDNLDGAACVIIHRDVKPGNILLSRPDPDRPYHFRAVIADFGYSSVQQVHEGQEATYASATGGDQIYCAPEVCRWHFQFDRLPTRASPASDVFSLGGVFSELAVWTMFGPGRVKAWLERRKEVHQQIRDFAGSGYEGCFHNGKRILSVVATMLDVIFKESRDGITDKIVRLIENQMLQPEPEDRRSARDAHHELELIVNEAREDLLHGRRPLSPPVTSTVAPESMSPRRPGDTSARRMQNGSETMSLVGPSNPYGPLADRHNSVQGLSPISPPGSTRLRRSSSARENLSMQQVLLYRKHRKNPGETPVDSNTERIILKIQKNLKDRDHLFFIDDTPSMHLHHGDMVEAFKGLAYVAKDIDPDGIELAFASSASEKPMKSSRTSPLVAALEQHDFVQDSSRMENSLSQLIETHVNPRLKGPGPSLRRSWNGSIKPLSIFIFTDGAWGDGDDQAYGVDRPIKNLINFLIANRFSRTQVVFQLIQFGHDPHGGQALKYLDDFGRHWKGGEWDIVDRRHITGNVYAMFLGSISEQVDQTEDDHPPAQSPNGTSSNGAEHALRQLNGQSSPMSPMSHYSDDTFNTFSNRRSRNSHPPTERKRP